MAYLKEERETVVVYEEFDDSWVTETNVRRHITKIKKRLHLYEVLAEEKAEDGRTIWIKVKLKSGTLNPFARTSRKKEETE